MNRREDAIGRTLYFVLGLFLTFVAGAGFSHFNPHYGGLNTILTLISGTGLALMLYSTRQFDPWLWS